MVGTPREGFSAAGRDARARRQWRRLLLGLADQLVGVAELVVAYRVEEHTVGELVRLAAHQDGDAARMREHGHERRACARDERAIEEHRARAEEHLRHLGHQVAHCVKVGVRDAQPGAEEAARHLAIRGLELAVRAARLDA